MAQELVFISYSRQDNIFVNRLRADLQKHRLNIWIDKTGLPPGTRNWERAIRKALQESFAVLWVVSPNSYASDYVQDEIAIAEMLGCPIYPVWAAGNNWLECVPLGMGKIQHVDARGDAYEKALEVIAGTLHGESHADMLTPVPQPDIPATQSTGFVPRNPYKGLRPFRETDTSDFFGRDTLIEQLRHALDSRLRSSKERFLAITGPSGSGKSSVIMAGLLPRLKAGALPDSETWAYLDPVVPGLYPIDNLIRSIDRVLPTRDHQAIRAALENPAGAGLHTLSLEIAVQSATRNVVLYIDQFEELFTQTASENERQQYINLLTHSINDPGSPLTIIISMRADFFDRPMNYPELGRLIHANSIPVLPMKLSDLREAIEKPASLADVQIAFEPGLVGDIVFELRDQSDALAGALPLLQFTLAQLFERREANLLTTAAYHDMGGVTGALAQRAEETYSILLEDEKKLARSLFLRLIEPGETEQNTTRRRAAFSELVLRDAHQTEMLQSVAEKFVQARLLLTDQTGDTTTLEVAHEAIIREWRQLQDWLIEAREDVRLQKSLATDAAEWMRRGQQPDDDGLYRGRILRMAQAWIEDESSLPSADEVAFVEASTKRQSDLEALEAQRTQELKLATVLAEQAQQKAQQAESRATEAIAEANKTAQIAEVSEKRALRARRLLYTAAVIAAIIAVAAIVSIINAQGTIAQSNEAMEAANNQVAAMESTVGALGETLTPAFNQIAVAQETLDSVQIQLETATSEAGLARGIVAAQNIAEQADTIFRTGDPQLALALALEADRISNNLPLTQFVLSEIAYSNIHMRFQGHNADISGVAFSPDGTRALSGSKDSNLLLWDLATGEALQTFEQHTDTIWDVVFLPDGIRALSASGDGRVVLWNLDTGEVLNTFAGHDGPVRSVAYAPEAGLALSAGSDRSIRAWDIETGEIVREYEAERTVQTTAISHDEVYMASGDVNGQITIWEFATGEIVSRFNGHTGTVYDVNFSPDDRMLLSASVDETLALWDVASGELIRRMKTGAWAATGVFSPDGSMFASAGGSNDLLLWETSSGSLIQRFMGHQNVIDLNSVAFSPDGHSLLSGSRDDSLLLWDITSANRLRTFIGHEGVVRDVRFALGGDAVISASYDGRLALWDTNSGEMVFDFVGHHDQLREFDVSADKRLVASGSCAERNNTNDCIAGEIIIWDAATGFELQRMRGHTEFVQSIAFSNDDRYVASGSCGAKNTEGDCTQGELIVWDLETTEKIASVLLHNNWIQDIVFLPSNEILTASEDATLSLSNFARLSEPVIRFRTHTGSVNDIALSPDGKQALSASDDGTLILWDIASASVDQTFVGHTGRVWSVDFSPDGTLAISGAEDDTVIVWDVETGKPLRQYRGHTNIVKSVAFSPDGRSILSGSDDQSMILWRLDNPTELRAWTHHNRSWRELTCSERVEYSVTPLCAGESASTWTPFPTLTETPTVNYARTTATATPTSTPVPPTRTLAPDIIAATAESDRLDEMVRQLEPEARRVWGLSDGLLPHDAEDGQVELFSPDVELRDFIASARFMNPYSVQESEWDIALFFRHTGGNMQYRLIVESSGEWSIALWQGAERLALASGLVHNLDTSDAGFNDILLIARGAEGRFYLNGRAIADLDLSDSMVMGDVSVVTGARSGHELAGFSTRYQNFSVWAIGEQPQLGWTPLPTATLTPTLTPTASLTPSTTPLVARLDDPVATLNPSARRIAGPLEGELIHDNDDNLLETLPAGIDVADFIAQARFYNPYPLEQGRWDMGLLFRHTGRNQHYRLSVKSDATWQLLLRHDDQSATIHSGVLPNLDTSEGGSNEIVLIVSGPTGRFLLNGEPIADLDLAGKLEKGNVLIAIGINNAHEITNERTRYEDFAIWQYEAEVSALATLLPTSTITPTSTPTITPTIVTLDSQAAALDSTARRVFGPAAGDLLHNDDDNQAPTQDSGILLRDFVVSATFTNPYAVDEGAWDYGFVIRGTHRLSVTSEQRWSLRTLDESGTIVASGPVPNLALGAGESNTLRLIIRGTQANFFVNDQSVGLMDLSGQEAATGRISVVTGILQGREISGRITAYTDFSIWAIEEGDVLPDSAAALSPLMLDELALAGLSAERGRLNTTASGVRPVILANVDNVASTIRLSGTYTDFVLGTTITWGPGAAEDQCGVWFRRQPASSGDNFNTVRINRLGEIVFTARVSEVQQDRQLGDGSSIDTRMEGQNRLLLVAIGDTFDVYINGILAGRFVQAGNDSGSIDVSAWTGDESDQTHCMFDDIWIYHMTDEVSPPVLLTVPPTVMSASSQPNTPTPANVDAEASALDSTARRIFGPVAGDLLHNADDTIVPIRDSGVTARDFVVAATFTNPYAPDDGDWDYGFIFRGNHRLVVTDDQRWVYRITGESTRVIGSGSAPSLALGAGESNTLRLIVRGAQANFFVNDQSVGIIDLSDETAEAARISAATGTTQGREINERMTRYTDFSVWAIEAGDMLPASAAALSPQMLDELALAGLSAEHGRLNTTTRRVQPALPPNANNVASTSAFNSTHTDFVLGTTITWGPGAAEDQCGIWFRQQPAANGFNFNTVRINRLGEIVFTARVNEVQQDRQFGDGSSIDTLAEGQNRLLLVAIGDTFDVYINGVLAGRFVEPGNHTGTISLSVWTEDESDQTHCTFEDTWIWHVTDQTAVPPGDDLPFEVGSLVRVNSQSNVNVRSGPGTSFDPISSAAPGTQLVVIGYNNELDWVNVRMESGEVGWISATLLR